MAKLLFVGRSPFCYPFLLGGRLHRRIIASDQTIDEQQENDEDAHHRQKPLHVTNSQTDHRKHTWAHPPPTVCPPSNPADHPNEDRLNRHDAQGRLSHTRKCANVLAFRPVSFLRRELPYNKGSEHSERT